MVSQDELAELDYLRAQFRRAQRDYVRKRHEILTKLEEGAEVESGPFRAEMTLIAKLSVD